MNIPQKELISCIKRMLVFPNATICRHAVALDILSILERYGFSVSVELADAILNANDEVSLDLLNDEG